MHHHAKPKTINPEAAQSLAKQMETCNYCDGPLRWFVDRLPMGESRLIVNCKGCGIDAYLPEREVGADAN